MSIYRNPTVAGLFYPADPAVLKNELETMLYSSRSSLNFSNIFGIIAPHAGYIYSGITAAYAYNLLKNKISGTVIILSPSHREYFNGSCIFNGDGYLTPLGQVDLDKKMSEKIINSSNTVFSGTEGHKKEHAVEVHLPFLQVITDNLKIVPIVMGDQDERFVNDLAIALAESADEDTIIIASSDLSHFHSRQEAEMLDSLVEQNVIASDYKKLIEDLDTRKCEACGGGAIAVLLKAAEIKNKNKTAILHRSDSGDVSGDLNEVVGYLSAVVYKE